MGWLLLQSFGTFDNELCEEIAKYYKVDIKTVKKYYKEFIEKLVNNGKENE